MGEVAVEQVDSTNGDSKDSSQDDVLHEKILSQLEYYFSDVNLSRDKFMQQQIRLDEGWIPVDLLLKFRRLAAILGERDKSVIVDAVRKSSMLEMSPEDDKVRRGAEHPLPDGYDELRKTLMTRTVYCKGFPLEGITFDQIFEFFKGFGKVESVIMRHYIDKASQKRGFKGSTFVTFPTVEEAEEFIKKEEVTYEDKPITRIWQAVYIDEKRKENFKDKLMRQQRRRENKKGGKKSGDKKTDKSKDDNEQEDERGGFPLGAVFHFSGVKENSTLQRDLIKEAVESTGNSVAFIDFNPGDLSGYIRLDQAQAAHKLLESLKTEENGKLKAGEEELELRVLEGEEETNYLERVKSEINKRRHSGARNKRKYRGGRGGHFGGDRGRKRKGGSQDGEPPAKIRNADD